METQYTKRRFTTLQIIVFCLLADLVIGCAVAVYFFARPRSATVPDSGSPFRSQLRRTSSEDHQENAAIKERDKAVKEATEADAKQIGVALLIYAQDYDESFPPGSGVDVPTLIKPLMNTDAEHLARIFGVRPGTPDADNPANPVFAYTFKGGKVPDAAVHTNALGYKRGPGGRAVFYADGHTKWKAD